MRIIEPLDMATVVDLVNEYAHAAREAAGETGEPYPVLAGLDDVRTSRLVALADELHRAFAEPDAAATVLNGLLDRHGLHRRLDGTGRLAWVTARRVGVEAAATVALVETIDRYGLARIGCCEGDRCVDVYVDTSPSRARRYCSERCQTRTRVARWRNRRAGPTATG